MTNGYDYSNFPSYYLHRYANNLGSYTVVIHRSVVIRLIKILNSQLYLFVYSIIKVARRALCTLWWQKFANNLNGLLIHSNRQNGWAFEYGFTTPSISHFIPFLPRAGKPP